jgi:hypothetical protein
MSHAAMPVAASFLERLLFNSPAVEAVTTLRAASQPSRSAFLSVTDSGWTPSSGDRTLSE